ncbi:sulfatase-like hydrolase/transferase [Neorhodopirellula pilleata]|uniref:Arylsulfatase n=1 Tax=Neorhodopirellula pilleata TaxID=2714738 RepID=A0A5C5ZI36_9BACT|nr:sulfatase-like hydrolase/transferase [Neorhodopirellula pilleata]TWT87079.1 Arylsulfatase [Neorhodopirellula pilleata]
MKNALIATLAFLVTSLAATPFCHADDAPPNIVLIFADDLGYGDVGCYGATKVKTPNIDRLAKEGRRFTDAHSASAVCTPSRYALLTGEYPFRQGIWGPCHPNSKLLVDTDKLTIAKLLKKKGYDTSCFGKWHLGFGKERNDWKEPLRPGPQDLGFDYYYGVPVVNSAPPYVYVENDRIVGMTSDDPLVYLEPDARENVTPITPLETKHGNRVPNWFGGAAESHKLYNDFTLGLTLAEKATRWIDQRGDAPFFLYLATTQIHHPFTPAPRFQGTSQCGLYGDFIHELDWIVGEVMRALEAKGVADDTLVIFTSDNGGMFNENGQDAFNNYGHEQNGDLLGFKFGAWEGGHRIPFIARWPGRIEPGSTSTQLICNVDLLASLASLTGQPLDEKQQVDSVNVLPALVGEPESALREHLILAPARGSHLSVRKGKWMLIDAQGSGGFGGTKPGGHGFAGPAAASYIGRRNSDIVNGNIRPGAPPAQLYDLQADVNETKNLYDEYPDVVKELRTILQDARSSIMKKTGAVATRNDAPKIPATPGDRSVSFDFESGKLEPWKVVEGEFGHLIGSRDSFFGNGQEYNKQGKHYLTTLEGSADAERGMDSQTGVIVSPLFVPEGGTMTFRVGGGSGDSTYAALCTADGKEVQFVRGVNDQAMQNAEWDLKPYVGQKMFIKVVDASTIGWGHVTVDDFQFDAKVLTDYPDLLKTK